MSDGALSFVSWVRRGLATGFTVTDAPQAGVPVIGANLEIHFNESNQNPNLDAQLDLPLIGPGDIVGLDSRVIVRLWPKPEDLDAEFDPYVLLEMDQADLPWRYTPAKASDTAESQNDRLRPWFSLVVLETSEGSITPPTPARKISVLNVSNVNALPNRSDLWAFAHTQFEGQNVTKEQAKDKITGAPGLFTARLMSSRLLRPNTEYIACLVPTFERGRLVGLGKLADNSGTDALAEWNINDAPFQLPVYFHWRFRTGSVGSFEQAARLIRPFVLPPSVGRRDMDVREPGPNYTLPSASNDSLPVEGALLSVAAAEQGQPEWPQAERDDFIAALRNVLNAPADAAAELPILAPPLYGQWYAAQQRLDEPANPPWFHELNSDPRNRVGAALGTKVIQKEQQALLAAGWEQVEEIRDINSQLRHAQLARGLSTRIFVRHFTSVDEQLFYHLTARVHALITCGDKTVCKRVQESPIVPGFLSAQWLRFSRPFGPLGRVQGRPGLTGFIPNLLRQLNECKDPAPDPGPPGGRHDPGDHPVPGGIPCHWVEELIGLGSSVTLFWGLVILWVARRLLVEKNGDCWWIGFKALRYAIGLIYISISGEDMRRRCRMRMGTLTVQDILNSPPMPHFVGFPRLLGALPRPTLPGGGPDSDQAAAVRAGLAALLQRLGFVPPELECGPHVDLEHCRVHLQTDLHPRVTVGRRVTSRLEIDGDVNWNPVDPLEPVLYTPEFERPMYEPLNQISSDWILPGLGQIKRDSIGLAVTNQRFIEAYMTGLNDEMTRELMWNEFPTDQRGTYFRQFWSIAGHILEDGSTLPPDQLRDIEPLRLWSKDAALGDNSPRPKAGPDENEALLVLVVRAQLIQKYPNVIVYAQQLNTTTQQLTGDQLHPVFYALIEPDVAFYGFQLTAEEIRNDPRWYFVLQEQPGDPKFVDRNTTRSGNTHHTVPMSFGTSAGLFAQSTFMQPFRLGIQATTLLPPSP